MPYYLAVGNHDNRAELRKAFPDHAYLRAEANGNGLDDDNDAQFVQYVVEFDALSLIVLDTQDPPQSSGRLRSEEHTSELQSLMRISYAVFCLKKKTKHSTH